jgi:hypothetical protein
MLSNITTVISYQYIIVYYRDLIDNRVIYVKDIKQNLDKVNNILKR